MLGVEIERNLNFDEYVFGICKKAGRKLSVLARMSKFMNFKQRRILMKTFIESQFGYCPLIWMFHGRTANRKINHLHERSLRIVYNDYKSSFENLLEKEHSVTIHQRNIQSFAIELFKIKQGASNSIFSDVFPLRSLEYNLRSQNDFCGSSVKTTKFGLNSLRYFASKVWSMIPAELRNIGNVDSFKNEIRKWKPEECKCKLCMPYINNIGYVFINK